MVKRNEMNTIYWHLLASSIHATVPSHLETDRTTQLLVRSSISTGRVLYVKAVCAHVCLKTRNVSSYRPLSICSGIFVSVHFPHWRHVSATTLGMRISFNLSGLVMNWTKYPAETCHAIWQWNGHTPVVQHCQVSHAFPV